MYRQKTNCRACGNSNLTEVYDLGVQPLANNFCTADQESAGHAPLKVMFCQECTNAQLSVVVDPNIIYRNYPYVTSKSETMRIHFGKLWDEICKECKPKTMVEIGSNDGLFLEYCLSRGVNRVIGVDPAQNLQSTVRCKEEMDRDLICSLFDANVASYIAAKHPAIDLVVARHVFCHIDDWESFICNLELLSNPDTLVAIEVPYVKDMLNGFEFDTIYHEHLNYMSIRAMAALLKDTMFHLHDIVRFDIHGGAIVMMLRRNDYSESPLLSVERFLELESVTLDSWKEFKSGANFKISAMKEMVNSLQDPNTVCGFGASAKSTVWINACGFSVKQIKFICDCTPEKQGKFSPGSNIPILPESALLDLKPDAAVMFAWNFKDEIIKKNQEFINRGGRFLIP